MTYWGEMSELSLPDDGRTILWRRKGSAEWSRDVVKFCWCGIEPAIKLASGKDVFPTLGDEWKYVIG